MKENDSLIELVKQWGIGSVLSIKKIYYTGGVLLVTTNSGNKYVLKEKRNMDNIRSEYLLLSSMEQIGVPVAAPMLSLRGCCCIQSEGKYYSLYAFLPGTAIHQHYSAGAEERAKSFGKAIALLHKGLKHGDNIDGFRQMDLFSAVLEDAAPRIKENSGEEDAKYISEIAEEFKRKLEHVYKNLPQQLIHKDIHPANMLFGTNGKLLGIIDFESVERGAKVFDLCYCCAYILIGGYEDENKREKWFELLDMFIEGYESYNHISKLERSVFCDGMIAALFILTSAFYKVWNMELARKAQKVIYWVYENRDKISQHL